MGRIRRADRPTVLLFPRAIDGHIAEDNPVRFADAFASGPDLARLGSLRANPAATGRPAYNPADLLKLYIYGYLDRVRSSRVPGREAGRNVGVMRPLSKLRPDFKTIADFRRGNSEAIKRAWRESALPCRGLGLFGGELVAVDGSKFRAVSSRRRNFNPAKPARVIKSVDERVAVYLAGMGQQDAAEPPVTAPSVKELRAKTNQLREGEQFHEHSAEELRERGTQEMSLTGPDGRPMSVGQGPGVCYNVRAAVGGRSSPRSYYGAPARPGSRAATTATPSRVAGASMTAIAAPAWPAARPSDASRTPGARPSSARAARGASPKAPFKLKVRNRVPGFDITPGWWWCRSTC